MEPIKLTREEWEKRFKPYSRTILGTHSEDPTTFDSIEHKLVAEIMHAKGWDVHHIWTVVESDEPMKELPDSPQWYIIEGWHIVNTQLFMLTEEPWQDGETYEIEF